MKALIDALGGRVFFGIWLLVLAILIAAFTDYAELVGFSHAIRRRIALTAAITVTLSILLIVARFVSRA